jgi:hypothetical protein
VVERRERPALVAVPIEVPDADAALAPVTGADGVDGAAVPDAGFDGAIPHTSQYPSTIVPVQPGSVHFMAYLR